MIRSLISLLTLSLFSFPSHAEVDLVTSIKPLQLIATAIAGERGTVRVLMPATGSAHHFSMAPSDRMALERADLIVYVGQALETELHEALQGLGADAPVLEVMLIDGLNILPFESDDGHRGAARFDPHVWLDYRNGLQIAATLRDRLIATDPAGAPQYRTNHGRFREQVQQAEAGWSAAMSSLGGGEYVVYHDAVGYFEQRFQRRHSLVLIEDPEAQPGMRHVLAVSDRLAELRPACILHDATARRNYLELLVRGASGVRLVELDLLGSRLGTGATYVDLIDGIVAGFSDCLGTVAN